MLFSSSSSSSSSTASYGAQSSLHIASFLLTTITISLFIAFKKQLWDPPFFICISIILLHTAFLMEFTVNQFIPIADLYCKIGATVVTVSGTSFICWNLVHTIQIYITVTGQGISSVPKNFLLYSHIGNLMMSSLTGTLRFFLLDDRASPNKTDCETDLKIVHMYWGVFIIICLTLILWGVALFKTFKFLTRSDVRYVYAQNLTGNFILFAALLAELLAFVIIITIDTPTPSPSNTTLTPTTSSKEDNLKYTISLMRMYGFGSLGIIVFLVYGLTPFNYRHTKLLCSSPETDNDALVDPS